MGAFLLLGLATPASSWDFVGHEVIARIAWNDLDAATKEEAVRLLLATRPEVELSAMRPRQGGRRDQILFERAATWPDYVRGAVQEENRPAWHYTNYFWKQDSAGRPIDLPDMQPAEVNLLTELPRLVELIADQTKSDHDRGVALAWILHLVGDLHQPLHCSARVTDADPRGDRGGNSFKLEQKVEGREDFRRDNLHSLWDSALTRRFPRSFWESGWRYRQRILSQTSQAPEDDNVALAFTLAEAAGIFDTWVLEGFALAKRACYPRALVRNQPAPDSVLDIAVEESRIRVRLAGRRLAKVLEAVL